MTDKTVKVYEISYLENRIPKIEKEYPMEVTEKPVTCIIEAAVKTAASVKKDKTSEAVIMKMTETRNKTEIKQTLEPVTLYRGGERRRIIGIRHSQAEPSLCRQSLSP